MKELFMDPLVIAIIVLIIVSLLMYRFSKNKTKLDRKRIKEESYGHIGGAIIVLVILYLIFQGFKVVTGYFGDKSDAKAACARHSSVINAQTDFAAKKAFKACLKRY